jgi:hypothetical protein
MRNTLLSKSDDRLLLFLAILPWIVTMIGFLCEVFLPDQAIFYLMAVLSTQIYVGIKIGIYAFAWIISLVVLILSVTRLFGGIKSRANFLVALISGAYALPVLIGWLYFLSRKIFLI